MRKIEFLAPTETFESQVHQLAKEGSEIIKSYANLTDRLLSFASSYREISEEAKRLDKEEDGKHSKYLRKKLSQAVKTTNLSILSRWNTIGEYANKLAKHTKYLPPQRDSLYEIALAVKEDKPLAKWIEEEKITIDTSFREIKALRNPKSRKSKTLSRRSRHLNAEVTIYFARYDEAANILEDFILSNNQFEIRAHDAFKDALKTTVGDETFKKIKNRFR